VTTVDRIRIVGALFETWDSITDLCSELSPAEWKAPTDCPGWSVQDHLAHMVGTESALAGRMVPDVSVDRYAYVRNAIGRSNEAWVEQRRSWVPEDVVEEFRAVTALRHDALSALSQDDFDAPSWTPAGPDTYGRFMQIRVMDCWTHEQDMREAVGRPGHQAGPAVAVALDEVMGALGYIIGKQAGAPRGSSVRLVLTGSEARTVDVAVEDRARVTEQPLADPTTTVTMPVTTFMRLAGGRTDPARMLAQGVVGTSGDRSLGEQVTTHLGYMI
jgi:uncharacterized protein (TIGR03083 family)